jgi:hypothetical protein
VKLTRVMLSLAVLLAAAMSIPAILGVLRADTVPQVQLNADSIGPRSIEELTGRNVTRDYAYAWRDLGQALDNNQKALLNDYFTGFAKDDFRQRIADQAQNGLRTRYVDHGHKVKAFFYSIDGSAMQLLDQAQIEVQVLDGGKIVHQENGTQTYLVLMTPGADRWFVRSLEPITTSEFPGAR